MDDSTVVWEADADATAPTPEPAPAEPEDASLAVIPAYGNRYTLVRRLGHGGMGSVFEATCENTGQSVALKVSHPQAGAIARMVREIQIMTMLHHQGIVPVFAQGEMPDGCPWFAMRLVRGRTLRAELDAFLGLVHGYPRSRQLRRLVSALTTISRIVASAHAIGVIHRDIKPQNVVVDHFGQVTVLDWGIAHAEGLDLPEAAALLALDGEGTVAGEEPGTPAYMAPEQAATGSENRSDARSDVYALGVILYEILSGGRPFPGGVTLRQRATLRPRPLAVAPQLGLHLRPLAELCRRAMAHQPAQRPPDAGAFADGLQDWLDGEGRRELARQLVGEAAELAVLYVQQSDEIRALHRKLVALHRQRSTLPIREQIWETEDALRALRQARQVNEDQMVALLERAHDLAPELPEARERLTAHDAEALRQARWDRDAFREARIARRLRRYATKPEHRELLDGRLPSPVRLPPGAAVVLYRYAERGRRLRPVGCPSAPRLARGSYLALVLAPGCHAVRLPFIVDFDAPEGFFADVPAPPLGSLSAGEVLVPGGPFLQVTIPRGMTDHPERRWGLVGDLVVMRYPVTNAQYVAFLTDLLRAGRADEAAGHVPAGSGYRRAGDRYVLGPDAQGFDWAPELPVLAVSWRSAQAWCRWFAEQTGQPWRLPTGAEWEKAACGVDGRLLPWGDHSEQTWYNNHKATPRPPAPCRVDAFPVDQSVYGVVGAAGNVLEYTTDQDPRVSEPWFIQRGAYWNLGPSKIVVRWSYMGTSPDQARPTSGFRAVRSLTAGR